MQRSVVQACPFILSLLLAFHFFQVSACHSIHHASHLHKRSNGLYDAPAVKIDPKAKDHNQDFFTFVTRPDIDAPRWDYIRKYDPASIAPGYFFLAPYEDVTQNKRGGGWVGPHIYDGEGELIWSGVPEFTGFDTFDFRRATVGGREDMLSLVYRHQNTVVLNSNYEVETRLNITDARAQLNMHDFNFVNNGSSVLMLKTITKMAEGRNKPHGQKFYWNCRIRYYGFEELNATTLDPIFSWSSEGQIGVDESYITRSRKVKNSCQSEVGYDYLHANAIDKFPDGDYLLSGRHCNTIYKISHLDGSIVWRLGGRFSDFLFNDIFSGQHDARVYSQNDTHTVISLLDNAEVPGATPAHTNDFSRGLLLSLRTDRSPMTAEILQRFDHPHGGYAPGRGSYQTLPSGNTFIGWTSHALHSEYDPEGRIIMEAQLRPKLKSYRSYKFPWVGHPKQPPDVHSATVSTVDRNETRVTTSVHVSWNGATEVGRWNLYKAAGMDAHDEGELIASMWRQGFETNLVYQDFASYVFVEALDHYGGVLPNGRSEIVKTIPPKDILAPAVVDEMQWVQDHDLQLSATPAAKDSTEASTQQSATPSAPAVSFVSAPIAAIVVGILGIFIGILMGWLFWHPNVKVGAPKRWQHGNDPGYEKIWEHTDGTESDAEADRTLVEEDDLESGKDEKESFDKTLPRIMVTQW